MKLEPMKHQHADAIIAWANGATIEYYSLKQLGNEKGWVVTNDPVWEKTGFYRVRLKSREPIVQHVFIEFINSSAKLSYVASIDIDSANCSLVFDGTTGSLIDCMFKAA